MAHPNAELYRRITEAFQKGDLDTVREGLAEDVEWHEAGNPDVVSGRTAVLERMSMVGDWLEGEVEIHDVLANDEHVVAMINAKLRKSDGSEVAYPAVEVAHVKAGRVTERWAFMDACPPEVTAFFAPPATADAAGSTQG